MYVYPLINYVDAATTRLQATLAMQSGSSGIVVSTDNGHDREVMGVAAEIKLTHPSLKVGLNVSATSPMQALLFAMAASLDMVWFNDIGFGPAGLSHEAIQLSKCAHNDRRIKMFVSLAPAYAWNALDPLAGEAAKFAVIKDCGANRDCSVVPGSTRTPEIARQLVELGFMPLIIWSQSNADGQQGFKRTTQMYEITKGRFAIASGTGPITLFGWPPYITHIIEVNDSNSTQSQSELDHLKRLVARVDGFDPVLLV